MIDVSNLGQCRCSTNMFLLVLISLSPVYKPGVALGVTFSGLYRMLMKWWLHSDLHQANYGYHCHARLSSQA